MCVWVCLENSISSMDEYNLLTKSYIQNEIFNIDKIPPIHHPFITHSAVYISLIVVLAFYGGWVQILRLMKCDSRFASDTHSLLTHFLITFSGFEFLRVFHHIIELTFSFLANFTLWIWRNLWGIFGVCRHLKRFQWPINVFFFFLPSRWVWWRSFYLIMNYAY